MENKKPRWENENWILSLPDNGKISCKDCHWREADRDLGASIILGSTLAMCKIYDSKPSQILFDNSPCPYHLSDKEYSED